MVLLFYSPLCSSCIYSCSDSSCPCYYPQTTGLLRLSKYKPYKSNLQRRRVKRTAGAGITAPCSSTSEKDTSSFGCEDSHIHHTGTLNSLFCFFPLWLEEKGIKQKNCITLPDVGCVGRTTDPVWRLHKNTPYAANVANIIDHYTEWTSPRWNHLLPSEQQMESALYCFHFNTKEVSSWDTELEG